MCNALRVAIPCFAESPIMDAYLVEWLARFGYAATFAGTLLEGETFLLIAGVSAQRGYLSLPLLVAVATCGALLTDNVFFAVGRVVGPQLFDRFPRVARSTSRVQDLVTRHPRLAVMIMRFMYGTRSVGPAFIGAGPMRWIRFVLLDAIAAFAWSLSWLGAGYLLGETAQRLFADLASTTPWMVLAAVAMAIALLVRHRVRSAWTSRRLRRLGRR
ncbi:MAG TPA: DedA family protein [Casimicrobiaceae bacterium]|nr:DedA family protein [Casimicrobiaceae bacterium]